LNVWSSNSGQPLVANKEEVVIVMPMDQLNTNTSPEAEKLLMA